MDATSFASDSPAGKILDHLQRHGEASVKEFEEVLSVSTTAVREHLTHLQARELLATRLVRQGPGRPRLVYFLTPKARSLVPKSYDTLVTMLMRELASRGGPDELQSLLDAVGARMAEVYRGQIGGDDVPQRLAQLRDALEARGIPVQLDSSGEELQVFACPYHDVAQEHAAVCTMEQRMLERLVGENIRIDGTIREGRRSCQFSIRTRPRMEP